jgi:hypothetical protein
MYIVISSAEVINNWSNIQKDTHNNNPEIKNPYEYIHKAKKGLVYAGGYQIVISDKMPEFE